ncbi:MAG: hypothetical protein AAGI68_00720 [Planctomycetota bacterium]
MNHYVRIALVFGMVLVTGPALASVGISVSGSDGDGYLAVVGANPESGPLSSIDRDPTSAKFFDYPAYVNPEDTSQVIIMLVEPYRFGLTYPDPLAPTGPNSFASVGAIQPASAADSDPQVTFIEAITEDSDFADFNIGEIQFDPGLISGSGTEIVETGQISIVFDETEFEGRNRDPSFQNGDFADPGGRANNNEFATEVLITATGFDGTGLTFEDGVLTSIDMVVDVQVLVGFAAFGVPTTFTALEALGELTFSGDGFAFAVDGVDSALGVTDVRVLLNRSGTIDAVGSLVIPEPAAAACIVVMLPLLTRGRAGRRR